MKKVIFLLLIFLLIIFYCCSYKREGFSTYHLKKKVNLTLRNFKSKRKEFMENIKDNIKYSIKKYLNLHY